MKVLAPAEAAAIARGVYRLRVDDVAGVRERGQSLGCEGLFRVADDARFQGVSGGLAWKRLSGCGYVAFGEGVRSGEVLVATRGTAMSVDWLSNLNVGLQLGPGGWPVHAGFHEVWKSFRTELAAALRNRNPSGIHCVGHSLGGALAALNADWFTANRVAPACLYTFGAPRTGDGLFARSLTQRLGTGQVFRVASAADPVPMIPLFPFWHLPHDRTGLELVHGDGALVSVAAHGMETSYVPAMTGQTWTTLAAAAAGRDVAAQSWLEAAAAGRGGFLMGSATLLTNIGRALRWLLAAARDLLLGALGVTLAVGATLLDQLAWLLARGAALGRILGAHVRTVIAAIFAFLGRTAPKVVETGVAFVRWVLELLYGTLEATARRAIAFVR